MLSRQWVLVALFVGAVLAAPPLYASDITIGPEPHIAGGIRTSIQNKKTGQNTMEEKANHRGRTRIRKISIYSLFGESLLKPGLNAASQPLSDTASAIKKPGVLMPGNTISNPQKSMFKVSENTDMAFDCREKSVKPLRRELTACYVHKVDKAWKARTYVTKKLVDNIPTWSGGLSLDYAY